MEDHEIRQIDDIWDVLEDDPKEAENLRMRSRLMIDLEIYISKEGMSKEDAARFFNVTPERISDLPAGEFDSFDLGTLVGMAKIAGIPIEDHVLEAAKKL